MEAEEKIGILIHSMRVMKSQSKEGASSEAPSLPYHFEFGAIHLRPELRSRAESPLHFFRNLHLFYPCLSAFIRVPKKFGVVSSEFGVKSD